MSKKKYKQTAAEKKADHKPIGVLEHFLVKLNNQVKRRGGDAFHGTPGKGKK